MKTLSLPLSGESGRLACCGAISPGFGDAGPDASCATSAIARLLQALHGILAHSAKWMGPQPVAKVLASPPRASLLAPHHEGPRATSRRARLRWRRSPRAGGGRSSKVGREFGFRGQIGKHLLVLSFTGFDREQSFADPGNSRVAQDMRRVDIAVIDRAGGLLVRESLVRECAAKARLFPI